MTREGSPFTVKPTGRGARPCPVPGAEAGRIAAVSFAHGPHTISRTCLGTGSDRSRRGRGASGERTASSARPRASSSDRLRPFLCRDSRAARAQGRATDAPKGGNRRTSRRKRQLLRLRDSSPARQQGDACESTALRTGETVIETARPRCRLRRGTIARAATGLSMPRSAPCTRRSARRPLALDRAERAVTGRARVLRLHENTSERLAAATRLSTASGAGNRHRSAGQPSTAGSRASTGA